MTEFTNLLGIRIFVSCIGCVGNLILIISISHSHAKISMIKSFEVFLLGLAMSNLEEIIIINIYDILILEHSSTRSGTWSCRLLKFLTISGELSSILFTIVICIFRYEKVRDAKERVNRPIYLDNVMTAISVSIFCFMISVSLSAPIFVLRVKTQNSTTNCPPDFYQCDDLHCPTRNYAYKIISIIICNILPMVVVTVTSCMIISLLLRQRKKVVPEIPASGVRNIVKKRKNTKNILHRSTVAVLAAMALFQVDWSLYLFLQLNFQASNYAFWNEMKFFVSTSYTSISPYVFAIGNDLFSIKHCTRK